MQKTSLGLQRQGNDNTLIVTLSTQIKRTSFIDEESLINDKMSEEIHQLSIDNGYITESQMLSFSYQSEQRLIYKDTLLVKFDQKILDKIKAVFRQSRFSNAVEFKVEPSLGIKYSLNSESDSYLSCLTEETKVSLNFKIQEDEGKFIDLQVKGVLISVLANNSIMILEGSSR